ncbi:E3 ubiquitin-protein ligase KEG [Armadillidium nasatum]|uniref:E3 ubiquitin-protein ligase KEG n=1 Tax=Armadillidium nasatum TaxID=96803 RepID=A0A5N5SIS9_9CRUS|nr:E3 ubiquitin-protein ligase KEG [Armadillidium nasatum]
MGNSEARSRRSSSSSNSSTIMESSKCYENISDQILFCGICFDEYESKEKIPMSMKCGHTYCKLCIDELLSTNPECPSCRESISKSSIVKNYGLLDVISSLWTKKSSSETFIEQLETLSEELKSEIDDLNKKSQMLTRKLEKVDELLKEPLIISVDTFKTTIAEIESTLDFINHGNPIVPKVIASPFPDPMNYMLKIYEKVESGVKMLCVHQPGYNTGLFYGNISVWSNTIFFHSLTRKTSNDCKEFLAFEDLKKVMPALKIKTFLKLKTKTGANQIILINLMESPLLSQFIRLCTGETGSGYKGASFEKGEDKDSNCKSVMKLVSYRRGINSDKGNVDYAFETTAEVCYRDKESVVVASLDGSFQIFNSDYKTYYKNVVGVIEIPLNLKDLLSYNDNVKIIEAGIAFQL